MAENYQNKKMSLWEKFLEFVFYTLRQILGDFKSKVLNLNSQKMPKMKNPFGDLILITFVSTY